MVPGLVQFSRMAEPSLAEPVWFRAACHGICRRYMDRATGGGNRLTHARHAAAGVCVIVLQVRSERLWSIPSRCGHGPLAHLSTFCPMDDPYRLPRTFG